MKKIFSLIILMSLIFIGSTNLTAMEIKETKGISDLCVNMEGTSFDRVVFKVNQDMDFDSEWDNIQIIINDKVFSTFDNFNFFEHLESGLESCGTAGSKGNLSKSTPKDTAIMLNGSVDDVNSIQILLGYTSDGVRYDERITYDVSEAKVSKIELYNDNYAGKMNDGISKKYNGYIIPMMGDASGFALSYDPDKGEKNFENAVDLGSVSYSDFNRTLEEVLNDVDKLIEKNNIKLPSEANSINKEFLEEIKSLNQSYTYEEKVGDKVSYSWTFDGSKITNTDLVIDLSLNVGESTNKEKIEALVPSKGEKLVLEFKYHGDLPEGTKVKVNVLDKFKNGSNLSLYYFNDNGSLEEVLKDLEVKDGFVLLNLEHCSEYVLVENVNNAQTGVINVVLYSILAFGSLVGIVFLMKKVN